MKGKRIAALLLALAMSMSLLCGSAWAADTVGDVPSESPTLMATKTGKCGDNVTWTRDDEGTLTISGTGEIKNHAFYNNIVIKRVVITYGVTGIGDEAFNYCHNLTSVTIPNSVTSIGNSAFNGCNLASLSIPNSVTNIGEFAFCYNRNLTSVSIPDSVTSIVGTFSNCTSLTSVTIPDSVTSIGRATFSYTGLTSVTIPNSVISIGNEAFRNCKSLTSMTIPDSVTSIGFNSFVGCTGMTDITIPKNVTSIDDYAFDNCTGLTSVTFLGDRPTISVFAFRNVSAVVFYPEDNATWNSPGGSFGGNLIWYHSGPFEYHRYRADYYLKNQVGIVEPTLFELSPTRTIYQSEEQKGFWGRTDYATKLWRELTNKLDAIDDPSTIPDSAVEKKDVYVALIFSLFQAATDDSSIINQINQKQTRMANDFYQKAAAFMRLKDKLKLVEGTKCADLTLEQRRQLLAWTNDFVNENAGIVKKGSDALDFGLDVFDDIKDISDYSKYVTSVCTLCSMNETQKQLMRDLYDKCPSGNKTLKAALKDCVRYMDASVERRNLDLMEGYALITEKNIGQYGVKALWDTAKATLALSKPYAELLWLSYGSSRLLCNALLATDDICEKYFTMEAILSIKKMLNELYQQNKANYLADRTSENAEILMTTIDLMFQCYDTDCETAHSFVGAVDSGIVSWCLSLFNAKDHTQIKNAISSLRNSGNNLHKDVLTRWLSDLEYQYPDEYEQYSYLLKTNIKECHITVSPNSYTFSGKARKPKVTVDFYGVPMSKGRDYTLSYRDNINAGEGKVVLTGTGNDYTGTMEQSFTIKKAKQTITAKDFTNTLGDKDFNLDAKTSGDGKLTYKSDKTKVAAVSKEGKITLKGSGKAKITITAAETNNCKKATKTVTVKVNKLPEPSINALTNPESRKMRITWKKVSGVDSYEVQYSTSSKFKTTTKVQVNGTSKTISKLTKNKKYYVRIRSRKTVNKKTFYSDWSGKKNVTIKK